MKDEIEDVKKFMANKEEETAETIRERRNTLQQNSMSLFEKAYKAKVTSTILLYSNLLFTLAISKRYQIGMQTFFRLTTSLTKSVESNLSFHEIEHVSCMTCCFMKIQI